MKKDYLRFIHNGKGFVAVDGKLKADEQITFKLKSFDGPVIITAPYKGNTVCNWNHSFNYPSHIHIQIGNAIVSLGAMNKWLDQANKNEKFIQELGIEFDTEYFRVKEIYKEITELVEAMMVPLIGKYEGRDTQIKITI